MNEIFIAKEETMTELFMAYNQGDGTVEQTSRIAHDEGLADEITVLLNRPATAGNLLLVYVGIDSASGTIDTPLGFNLAAQSSNTAVSQALFYKVAVGGEYGSYIPYANAQEASACIVEIVGSYTFESATIPTYAGTTAQSISTGNSTVPVTADSLCIAVCSVDNTDLVSGTRAWTNGFKEAAVVSWDTLDGDTGWTCPAINLATKLITATVAEETTFSYAGGTAAVGHSIISIFSKD